MLAKNATLTEEEFSTHEQFGVTTQVHLLPSCQVNLSVSKKLSRVKSDPIILLQSSQKSFLKLRASKEARKGG